MRRFSFTALVVLVTRLASAQGVASSAPQASETDTVTLNDGTVLRGVIAEARPGQSLTIVLATGEQREIAASTVASATGPGAGPFGSPMTPPPAPAVGNAGGLDDDRARYLHAAPDRVQLAVRSDGASQLVAVRTRVAPSAWLDVCWTPCTLWVLPGPVTLHTRAPNIADAEVDLNVTPPGLGITMRAVSARAHSAAGTLSFLGPPLLGFGVASCVFELILFGTSSSLTQNAPYLALPAAALLGGATVLITGILLGRSNRTGLADSRPLHAARRPTLHLAASPIPAGAMATLAMEF